MFHESGLIVRRVRGQTEAFATGSRSVVAERVIHGTRRVQWFLAPSQRLSNHICMKNLMILSAVVLFMLAVVSFLGPQSGQKAGAQRSIDPDEQALRDAGYYDDEQSQSVTSTKPSPRTPAFQHRVGEKRRIPPSARLPVGVQRNLCGLRRTGGEADLLRIFGTPDVRRGSPEVGFSLLTWNNDAYDVSATLSEKGTLDLVVANSNMTAIKGDARLPPVDLSGLSAEQSTLADVEDILGPGVLTKVSWEKGLDIPLGDALERGLQENDVRDHCEMLYTWLVPGRARPLTIAFSENNMITTSVLAMFQ